MSKRIPARDRAYAGSVWGVPLVAALWPAFVGLFVYASARNAERAEGGDRE